MWRCSGDVEMLRCVDVKMCKCGGVVVELWRCGDV